MNEKKMPKGYYILWSMVAAAYAVWMALMTNTVLRTYETAAARTVDGVLYPDITGLAGRHWLYPVWIICSTVCLMLFIIYLRYILYGDPNKGIKIFCAVALVYSFVFTTVYAILGDRYTIMEKLKYVTGSMIGLDFPWLFRLWGVLTSMAVFTNTVYAYKKHGFNSRVGIILGSVGSAAIYMTVNLPSVGETPDFSDPRCLFHWAGALLFAFLCAVPLGILLFSKGKKGNKRFKVSFISFILVVFVMTALLVTVGKSALIENLPLWGALIVLFMLNFTGFYDEKTPRNESVSHQEQVMV